MQSSVFFAACLLLAGCSASNGQVPPASQPPQTTPTSAGVAERSEPVPVSSQPAAAPVDRANDPRPGIAVFRFDNGGSFGKNKQDLEDLRVGMQQMLLTELSMNPNLRIVERGALQEVLNELDLGASGRVDPNTAARVGKLIGARYLVFGSFVDLDRDFNLNARIVDGETGEIINAQRVRDKRENMYDLVVDLADKLARDVRLPPLPAAALAARKNREIPPQAITLYSRAQVYADAGRTEQAVQLYRQIAQEFPQMTEAREALRQLSGGN